MTLARRRDLIKFGAAAAAGMTLDTSSSPVLADTTLPGPRSASVLPGGKGPNSGLPWFSGGFGNADLFAKWRGRPFDVYTSFITYDSWGKMQGFPGNTNFPSFAKKPVWISLAYPWLPKDLGDTVFTSFWDEAAEFDPTRQTAAASRFWTRHLQILGNIATCLRASGSRCLGLILRVAWEFNGSSYCRMTDYTKCPQYRAIFQHFVDEARRLLPDVVIEWNPLRKGTEGAFFDEIWPGDDYVDIVSICHYDRMPSFDSQQIWDDQAVRRYVKTKTTYTYEYRGTPPKKVKIPHTTTLWDNPWGIETWAEFAVQHGKKFGVPEWGLTNGWSYTDNCQDRDNPRYMELMMKFFNDHADIMGYESYFNSAARHMIYPPGEVPYDADLETDAAKNSCDVPSPNWPSRQTSVNNVAAQRYKDLIASYYALANPAI